MNFDQFNSLLDPTPQEQYILVLHEVFGRDRTLIYGYNTNRDTFHLYLKDKQIHSVYYNGVTGKLVGTPRSFSGKIRADDCVPNKRVYPARCDYEFCKLLLSKGIYIPFTTWQDVTEEQFHGSLIESFD